MVTPYMLGRIKQLIIKSRLLVLWLFVVYGQTKTKTHTMDVYANYLLLKARASLNFNDKTVYVGWWNTFQREGEREREIFDYLKIDIKQWIINRI